MNFKAPPAMAVAGDGAPHAHKPGSVPGRQRLPGKAQIQITEAHPHRRNLLFASSVAYARKRDKQKPALTRQNSCK